VVRGRFWPLSQGITIAEIEAACSAPPDEGKHIAVAKNDAVVFEQVWNFDDQPIAPLDLTGTKGDRLGLECTQRQRAEQGREGRRELGRRDARYRLLLLAVRLERPPVTRHG
jgi:hypothetical protein